MLKKVQRIKLGKQIYRRLMKRVLERDEWRCQKCGSLENLQVHHKIKRSQLGNDSLDNLVTLCAYCHMGEHGQLFYSVPAVRVCSKPKPTKEVKTLPAVISEVANSDSFSFHLAPGDSDYVNENCTDGFAPSCPLAARPESG